MATLQKLRNNKITPIAIGVAMLLFVVTLFLKQGGGEGERDAFNLNGKTLDINAFNAMVEETENYYSTMQLLTTGQKYDFNNEEVAQIREMVYQQYISNQMLEEECEKLGITVTNEELQNIIKTGNNPRLMQNPVFAQQGAFSFTALQQFLKQHDEMSKNPQVSPEEREMMDRVYRMWLYTEKELRKDVLTNKYQTLLASLMLSNPISAKQHFEASNNETEVLLAAVPYTSIEDKDVKVEDSDIQAKYNEKKEAFYRFNQSRDLKFIDVIINASKEDEEALQNEMNNFAEQMQAADANIENIVRRSQSTIAYIGMPVSKDMYASVPGVAACLDTMAVNTQTAPFRCLEDNTMNIVKLMDKITRPDSIEIREIDVVFGKDQEASKKSADSIYTALQAGQSIDSIAKFYNQTAEKHWVTSQMYESGQMDKTYTEAITSAAAGSYNKIELPNGIAIFQVTDRRNMEEKYQVAVIKREIAFGNETSTNNFNKLSTFVASNKTVKDMEKNSKGEFNIQTLEEVQPMQPAIANIADSREIIRWAYNEDTKVGDVSEIFYCGKKREHLVVAVLTAIHEEGYADAKEEVIKNQLRQLVIADKKAAMIQDKMKNAKSIAEVAQIKGAVQDTIQNITFANTTYIQKTGAREVSISGAASAAAKDKFVAGIRGEEAVYAFKVINKTAKATYNAKENEKEEMMKAAQEKASMALSGTFDMYRGGMTDMRNPNNIFYNNYKNAKKKDNRILFF
ncbi:MAG: SurA N-terminal domain-containing protein [Bacteroidales bacterium]|nr:SurA N-terminal domain-containing protein [Bacteroidales bacterium]